MHFSAAMILLHRPLAQFGKDSNHRSPTSETSRQICVDNACLIARYAMEYCEQHGSVLTMSWISLHIVATAATTLIANIAESESLGLSVEHQLGCLRDCLSTLNELEKSHVVTRRVRRVIQQAIRLLNLDATLNTGTPAAGGWNLNSLLGTNSLFLGGGGGGGGGGVGSGGGQDQRQFPLFDLLPPGPQFDMLNSFQSYFS